MNFGPTHFAQTCAVLKRDPKRASVPLSVHSGRSFDTSYRSFPGSPVAEFSSPRSQTSLPTFPDDGAFSLRWLDLQTLHAYGEESRRVIKILRELLGGDLETAQQDERLSDLCRFISNFERLEDDPNSGGSYALLRDGIDNIRMEIERGYNLGTGFKTKQEKLIVRAEARLNTEQLGSS